MTKSEARPPQDLDERHRFAEPVYVTKPTLPKLEDYQRKLERIWETRWLTNDGECHTQLA